MKLHREISGEELSKLLKKYDYAITRQTGSHIRLTTALHGEHHITILAHKYLKIGTLSSILSDIAIHFKIDKSDLIKELFYHGLSSTKLSEIEKMWRNTKMKSLKNGRKILVSVENITAFGIWLFVKGKEYFLDYQTYPYFQRHTIETIKNVRLLHGFHLHWPDLDVDIEIDNLENPEKYPLKSKI